MLNKEDCLFERDEKGELIGKLIKLETFEGNPEIKIKPLTRGKLMSIFQKAKGESEEEKVKGDNEVLLSGLIEPIFTEEEIEVMKPRYVTAIATAIISVSLGITQEEVKSSNEDVLRAEAEIKK